MSETEADLRKEAKKSIKRKRDFWHQVITFVALSAFFTLIWAVGGQGFFWPIFIIAAFVLSLAFTGYNAYARHSITDADIDREVAKLKQGS